MTEHVNPKRAYRSPRREAQAAATRAEILAAAQRLFEQQGYAATTMAAVASEARVALKTVYVAFETKSGLLRALWNARLRGDDEEIPVSAQDWYRAVLEERDPERQLRRNARNSAEGKQRIGALAEVIRAAAAVDEDIAALWSRIQTEYRANQHAIVATLADKKALRRGLDVERAADILWTINHPSVWQLLVVERGWTQEDYERWSGDLACAQLLRPVRPKLSQAT
jgi:AcrR family transcriptional regulator